MVCKKLTHFTWQIICFFVALPVMAMLMLYCKWRGVRTERKDRPERREELVEMEEDDTTESETDESE